MPREGGGAVAVVDEGDAAGQRARSRVRAGGREAGGGDRERARRARGERGGVGAGDGRGLVDGEREVWVASAPTPLVAVMVSA